MNLLCPFFQFYKYIYIFIYIYYAFFNILFKYYIIYIIWKLTIQYNNINIENVNLSMFKSKIKVMLNRGFGFLNNHL